jgi:RimJ/RimL family protein N-acetyltransferase
MVSRGVRGRGIGSALLGAAEDWARGVGVRKIELHVFPHNDAAIALYERSGYVREGYRREQFLRGDELVDAILMAKLIE